MTKKPTREGSSVKTEPIRKANAKNPYQGDYKRVLCVCSAGVLRSPTVALVLSMEPFNFNTRAAGLDKAFALVHVDDVLIEWADELVCMDEYQERVLKAATKKPIHNLNIGDSYNYRDPALIAIIKGKAAQIWRLP